MVKLRRHFRAGRRAEGGEEEEQRGGRRPSKSSRERWENEDDRLEEDDAGVEEPRRATMFDGDIRAPFSKSREPREVKTISTKPKDDF